MYARLKLFFQRWLFNTLGVFAAAFFVRNGIHAEQSRDLVVAALLLGLLNTFVRPFLMAFALPLVLMTLGIFILVINAALLYLVGSLMCPHFCVDTFGAAFWGALIITLVSMILGLFTGTGNSRFSVKGSSRNQPPPPSAKPPEGKGPIIDV